MLEIRLIYFSFLFCGGYAAGDKSLDETIKKYKEDHQAILASINAEIDILEANPKYSDIIDTIWLGKVKYMQHLNKVQEIKGYGYGSETYKLMPGGDWDERVLKYETLLAQRPEGSDCGACLKYLLEIKDEVLSKINTLHDPVKFASDRPIVSRELQNIRIACNSLRNTNFEQLMSLKEQFPTIRTHALPHNFICIDNNPQEFDIDGKNSWNLAMVAKIPEAKYFGFKEYTDEQIWQIIGAFDLQLTVPQYIEWHNYKLNVLLWQIEKNPDLFVIKGDDVGISLMQGNIFRAAAAEMGWDREHKTSPDSNPSAWDYHPEGTSVSDRMTSLYTPKAQALYHAHTELNIYPLSPEPVLVLERFVKGLPSHLMAYLKRNRQFKIQYSLNFSYDQKVNVEFIAAIEGRTDEEAGSFQTVRTTFADFQFEDKNDLMRNFLFINGKKPVDGQEVILDPTSPCARALMHKLLIEHGFDLSHPVLSKSNNPVDEEERETLRKMYDVPDDINDAQIDWMKFYQNPFAKSPEDYLKGEGYIDPVNEFYSNLVPHKDLGRYALKPITESETQITPPPMPSHPPPLPSQSPPLPSQSPPSPSQSPPSPSQSPPSPSQSPALPTPPPTNSQQDDSADSITSSSNVKGKYLAASLGIAVFVATVVAATILPRIASTERRPLYKIDGIHSFDLIDDSLYYSLDTNAAVRLNQRGTLSNVTVVVSKDKANLEITYTEVRAPAKQSKTLIGYLRNLRNKPKVYTETIPIPTEFIEYVRGNAESSITCATETTPDNKVRVNLTAPMKVASNSTVINVGSAEDDSTQNTGSTTGDQWLRQVSFTGENYRERAN